MGTKRSGFGGKDDWVINEINVKCFLTLAETLNFTKTAKELYITQQAVSQHISRLEEDLGFPLFIRSRHFVALTQAGKSCYDFFSDTKKRFEALVSEARTHYAALSRTIHAGYQNWIDLGPAVGAALQRLRTEAPDLEMRSERSSPGVLINRLLNRELQIVVMYDRWAPRVDGLEILKLMDTPAVLMVSPDNPLVTPEAEFKTFIHEPFVIDRFAHENDAQTNKRAKQEISMFGLAPSRILVVPDRDSAYTAAELGQGTIITTGINRIVRSSRMKVYPTDVMESLVCVWHADEENALVEKFARYLQSAYREMGDGTSGLPDELKMPGPARE